MQTVIYSSESKEKVLDLLNPLDMLRSLYKNRELIQTMTAQSFRMTYHSSRLGVGWQIFLPMIMLGIFYLVFGVIMGGKFSQGIPESPIEYALAIFLGLGIFNFISINIGNSTSLIASHQVFVKHLSFPIAIIPVVSVLGTLITLFISLGLSIVSLLIIKQHIFLSELILIPYLFILFMLALGLTWMISSLAVFYKDLAALTPPFTMILMFLCPIFYPASLVPSKLKWIIALNPLAKIIEDLRNSILYGLWPTPMSFIFVFIFSFLMMMIGYIIFMKLKDDFADIV